MSSNFLNDASVTVRIEDLVGLIGSEVAKAVQTKITNDDLNQIKMTTNKFCDLQNENSSSSASDEQSVSEIAADYSKINTKTEEDAFELRKLKFEFEQLKSTLGKVINDTNVRSCLTAQNLREEVSAIDENCKQTLDVVQTEANMLKNENQLLKVEMAEKAAKIINMQRDIDGIKKDQLGFHELVSKLISDARNKLDDMERIEKTTSQFLTENLELKYKQNQNIDEIMLLKANLSRAEDLINLTRADVKQLKIMDAENKEQQKASHNECQTFSDKGKGELALLQEEVENSKSVCPCRSEATFTFTIQNINQLKSYYYSPPIYVRMLPWKMFIQIFNEKLDFYLKCNDDDKSSTWSCSATAELRLKYHKQDPKLYRRPQTRFFDAEQKAWVFPAFMTLTELLDPKNGYVNNNSITLEIYVKDEPFSC